MARAVRGEGSHPGRSGTKVPALSTIQRTLVNEIETSVNEIETSAETDASKAPLPAGHPEAAHGRIGVLLLNLGTPDDTDYWSMRRYL